MCCLAVLAFEACSCPLHIQTYYANMFWPFRQLGLVTAAQAPVHVMQISQWLVLITVHLLICPPFILVCRLCDSNLALMGWLMCHVGR